MAWGFFFGTLPDLDILAYPFLEQADQIRIHRGLSHSILVMILATLVFAKPLAWLHRGRGLTAKEAGWFVFLTWSTHVLIDVFTTYGTQVFEPFSDQRVAWSNLAIIDFCFTLPMLIGLVMVLRHEPGSLERGRVMRRALAVSCVYVMFSFAMKLWASDQIRTRAADEIPGGRVVSVAPTLFNTFLWRGLIETEDAYWVVYWGAFDEKPAKYEFVPKNRELAEKFEGEELFDALKWFSRGHWVARELDGGEVAFIDVRFGEMRDLENKRIYPRFQWHLSFDEEGKMQAPTYRKKVDKMAMLGLLMNRVIGRQDRWEEMMEF